LKLARRIAYVAAGLVVLVIALGAAALTMADTPAMRAEIQRRLSDALQGKITWEALDIDVFPRPRGVLRRVQLEVPGATASAEELQATVQFWPLLRGQVELAAVTLRRPQVRLQPGQEQSQGSTYRAAVERVVRALRAFAPGTELRIDDALLDVPVQGKVLELRGVSVQAQTGDAGAQARIVAASNLWKQLRIDARLDYASLATRAEATVEELDLAALAPAGLKLDGRVSANARVAMEEDLRAELEIIRTDARLHLARLPWPIALQAGQASLSKGQVSITGVRGSIGDTPLTGLAAQIELGAEPRLSAASGSAELDFDQWIPWLRAQFPLEDVARLTGSARVRLEQLSGPLARPAELRYDLVVVPHKVTVESKHLPGSLNLDGGAVRVTPAALNIQDIALALLGADARVSATITDYAKAPRISAASARGRLGFGQWYPWAQSRFGIDDVGRVAGAAEIRLERLSGLLAQPAKLDYEAVVTPQKVAVESRLFPAPLRLDGGAVRITPAALKVEGVAVALLDSNAVASATVTDYARPRIEASASGELGPQVAAWAAQRADAARFEPETPLRFALERLAWGPDKTLQAAATLRVAKGPEVTLDIASTPGALDLRRLVIKDARSNAALSAHLAGEQVKATFSGALDVGSVSALLKNALPGTGRIAGDLSLAVDRRNPKAATAEGKLTGSNVDLEWLAGRPLRILRLDVAAHQLGLRIGEITLELDGQPATLRGEIQRSAEGPVIDARLESPGIVLDNLLPPASDKKTQPSALWPLPVTGRIEVAAGFLQHEKRRVAPVQGTLRLEAQRARIELREARMCGVSFPLEVEAQPDGYAANVRLEMNKEPLEKAVLCLSGEQVQISGATDLRADLATRGKPEELLRNLTGTLRLDVRDGRLQKLDLLGRILSIANFSNISEVHKAAAAGIPYRTIVVGGHFEGGQFVVQEAGLDSSALRLAASGHVGMVEPNTQLTVLVAPLASVDRVVGAIPIVGNVLGGVLTTVPVAVSGDIRDPRVVPLGPHAVSDQLLGVLERTLKLPGKLVAPQK
jgi:hypothetical protein